MEQTSNGTSVANNQTLGQDEHDKFVNCIGASDEYYRFMESQYTLVYMAICLTCTAWQIMTAISLIWKSRKWLHAVVLLNVCLAFFVILCSLLNPLTSVSCEFRYWVSIICVNLGGCCIQSILLYKAYICHNRRKWLLVLGSFINTGYVALIFLYATIGKVDSHRDFIGNCVLNNLEWPALAKLSLDISSNLFLTFAFLSVIRRHYRMLGNDIHKFLFSNSMMFSIGVVASNILTAILISCRAVGGLSADLYSFDWVITGYLLIKQFTMDTKMKKEEDDDDLTPVQSTASSILSAHISGIPGHHSSTEPCITDTHQWQKA
ncbi:uncharacterized protein BX664DRAFT_381413 [Halteromyces radiatus]|uniref:uncharacterized protein n=1 Tax=Halteromyces radiatus TaxID=101107 RepID=UPI00221E4B32|nr:uncharacterized protein BX664DRAFT_381413 [Halteromyces radiatus]KAI8098736.1 hypothetical protein BX664DRAFT_381413 [Halteromyces radiatus]